MSSETTAVAKGAALLDEKRPGWVDEIDLDTLDVWSTSKCVVSQVYGSWSAGNEALGTGWDFDAQVEHGFEVGDESRDGDGYAALTQAWREEIERRRAA